MTEDQARAWLADVPRETISALDRFVEFLAIENQRQNLIAASTMGDIWNRHIVDSAQLLSFAPAGNWLDLGSGAGFPGLIIAAIGQRPVTLVESRTRRSEFLRGAANILGITALVEIVGQRLEQMPSKSYAVISARAFAPLDRLLTLAAPFATPATCWLLPKGRGAQAELAAARGSWQGDFRIVPSVTDPDSAIIVAANVGKKRR